MTTIHRIFGTEYTADRTDKKYPLPLPFNMPFTGYELGVNSFSPLGGDSVCQDHVTRAIVSTATGAEAQQFQSQGRWDLEDSAKMGNFQLVEFFRDFVSGWENARGRCSAVVKNHNAILGSVELLRRSGAGDFGIPGSDPGFIMLVRAVYLVAFGQGDVTLPPGLVSLSFTAADTSFTVKYSDSKNNYQGNIKSRQFTNVDPYLTDAAFTLHNVFTDLMLTQASIAVEKQHYQHFREAGIARVREQIRAHSDSAEFTTSSLRIKNVYLD